MAELTSATGPPKVSGAANRSTHSATKRASSPHSLSRSKIPAGFPGPAICGGRIRRVREAWEVEDQSSPPYECRPSKKMFTPYRFICMVRKPSTAIQVATGRFTLGVARACR